MKTDLLIVLAILGCEPGILTGLDGRDSGVRDALVPDAALPDGGEAPADAGTRFDGGGDAPIEVDAGPFDSGVDAGFDTGVDAGVDSGPGPVVPPPGEVTWIAWPSQHATSDGRWGTVLTDVVQHLPRSYGDTYFDADTVTYGHETTHGINSHIRNYLNDTGRRANGFYCLHDRAAVVAEPNMRKSHIAEHIPSALRGSRFDLYITGSPAWDDTPLYIWDEWIAYVNGGEVGLDRATSGLWTDGWRDAMMGPLEFTVYAIATAMAVEARDPTYFGSEAQFHAFFRYNVLRAMTVFRAGRDLEDFRWDRQDAYYDAFRTGDAGRPLRDFLSRAYGDAFLRDALDL